MTCMDLAEDILAILNAIQPGETPTAAEAESVRRGINGMIDAWRNERLMTFQVRGLTFDLAVGQGSYTMGPGGDFDIPRPVKIDRASIINLQNPLQPLELPIPILTTEQWQRIPVKNLWSSLPRAVYDDDGFPWRTLYFWYIPSVPVQAVFYLWTLLEGFADLVTDYKFPPGYYEAIKFNAALRTSMSFGGYMPPQLAQLATEAKAAVKSINIPQIDLLCDPGITRTGLGLYNWLTDTGIGT